MNIQPGIHYYNNPPSETADLDLRIRKLEKLADPTKLAQLNEVVIQLMGDLFSTKVKVEEQGLAWNTTKFKFNERLDEIESVVTTINDRINAFIEEVQAERAYRALWWWQKLWLWMTE